MAHPSELDCPVCMNIILPPIMQCSNGHHLCSQCTQRIQTSNKCRCKNVTCSAYSVKCPMCRVDIAVDKMTEDKELEERARSDSVNIHACAYAPDCPFTGIYVALSDHSKICPFKIAQEKRDATDALAAAKQRDILVNQNRFVLQTNIHGILYMRRAQRAAQDAPYHVNGINIPEFINIDAGNDTYTIEDALNDFILRALESDDDQEVEEDEEANESSDESTLS